MHHRLHPDTWCCCAVMTLPYIYWLWLLFAIFFMLLLLLFVRTVRKTFIPEGKWRQKATVPKKKGSRFQILPLPSSNARTIHMCFWLQPLFKVWTTKKKIVVYCVLALSFSNKKKNCAKTDTTPGIPPPVDLSLHSRLACPLRTFGEHVIERRK